jgi:hypothetical protein
MHLLRLRDTCMCIVVDYLYDLTAWGDWSNIPKLARGTVSGRLRCERCETSDLEALHLGASMHMG